MIEELINRRATAKKELDEFTSVFKYHNLKFVRRQWGLDWLFIGNGYEEIPRPIKDQWESFCIKRMQELKEEIAELNKRINSFVEMR